MAKEGNRSLDDAEGEQRSRVKIPPFAINRPRKTPRVIGWLVVWYQEKGLLKLWSH